VPVLVNKIMIQNKSKYSVWYVSLLLLWLILISGCAAVEAVKQNTKTQQTALQTYSFEPALSIQPAARKSKLVIAVLKPRAAAPYRAARMAYSEAAYELNYYINNEWASPPAAMLEPFIVKALEQSQAFDEVVSGSNNSVADIVLDIELIDIKHQYSDAQSVGVVTLRAQFIDLAGRRIIGVHELSAQSPAASNSPYGGVAAINGALSQVLVDLANYCSRELPLR